MDERLFVLSAIQLNIQKSHLKFKVFEVSIFRKIIIKENPENNF